MRESLMEIIVCPVCKSTLDLTVSQELTGEIMTGTLYCRKCDYSYPIKDSIPNLLPPSINRNGKSSICGTLAHNWSKIR